METKYYGDLNCIFPSYALQRFALSISIYYIPLSDYVLQRIK
jgi:hypothetical protein